MATFWATSGACCDPARGGGYQLCRHRRPGRAPSTHISSCAVDAPAQHWPPTPASSIGERRCRAACGRRWPALLAASASSASSTPRLSAAAAMITRLARWPCRPLETRPRRRACCARRRRFFACPLSLSLPLSLRVGPCAGPLAPSSASGATSRSRARARARVCWPQGRLSPPRGPRGRAARRRRSAWRGARSAAALHLGSGKLLCRRSAQRGNANHDCSVRGARTAGGVVRITLKFAQVSWWSHS